MKRKNADRVWMDNRGRKDKGKREFREVKISGGEVG